jgi:uncharacterized protein (DUF1800 family)
MIAVSQDPAMLLWLDGNNSRKKAANENYARELMELFTMGIGHYTEADVKAAARAFTGWFIDRNRNFIFNANQHDGGTKTFLGRSGPWNGDDVVDIILDQPSAAEFLTRKLFGFLVHDHPSSEAVLRLAATFQGSGYSIRELVRAILLSPEFSSEDSYHALVKSPVEYLVGTLKLLGIAEISPTALGALQRMGMVLFNPPNVAGWAWGDDWIGSASLLERLNVANALVTQRGDNARFGLDPTALLERLGAHSPTEIAAGLLDLLVEGDVPAGVRESLLAYAMNGYPGSPADFASNAQRVDRAVRGVARLVMATPASQMA